MAFLPDLFKILPSELGTLKMFLLSAQNNFYIILSSRVRAKKNSSLNFMSSVGFQVIKIWVFFWKIFCGAILVNANNNIRSIILEIKNDRCKIVKIQIFRSLSREHIHFHLLWKCSRKRERNISILTILHVSFLISNMTLLIIIIRNFDLTS